MKKQLVSFVIAVFTATLCSALNFSNAAIEIVKNSPIDNQGNSVEAFVGQVAGVEGTVEWRFFTAEGETNPNVQVVEVALTTSKARTAKLRFKVNVSTKATKLYYLEVDGEAESILDGVVDLSIIAAENYLQ